MNHPDGDGTTPLSKAILYSLSDVTDRLMSRPQCDVNAGSKSIPLHEAVTRTDESLISRLLRRGANINKVQM